MILIYDDKVFVLRKGRRKEVKHEWTDFSRVSVYRTEYGEVAVRLYFNEEFFDLPASKLRLGPFDFRKEVMKLIHAT